jgi:hypothetical protein
LNHDLGIGRGLLRGTTLVRTFALGGRSAEGEEAYLVSEAQRLDRLNGARLRFPLLMRLMAEAEPAFLIKRIVPD